MKIYQALKEYELTNPESEYTRYFDCVGHPEDCRVFLVGTNPSVGLPLNKSFWEYYTPETGFDHGNWYNDYQKETENKFKPTRTRIEELRGLLKAQQVSLLNCNVYNVASKREADLPVKERRTAVFRMLFDMIQPELLIVQGETAKTVIAKMYDSSLAKAPLWGTAVLSKDRTTKILFIPHMFNLALDEKTNPNRNLQIVNQLALELLKK
jgi:hypothetical protein